MKVKPGFTLRDICGEYIIVAEGLENIDFSNIISLNESSAYLWRNIEEMESFTVEDLARLLTEEYDVDMATAVKDSEQLVQQWLNVGVVSE